MNIQKQWITTNMRFPADDYMALKLEAINKKMSVTSLIHKKLFNRKKNVNTKINIAKAMLELNKLAKEVSKYTKGISLSEKLIEMRYEQ